MGRFLSEAALVLILATPLAAQHVWTVGESGADFTTIQAAIDAAASGDVVLIRVPSTNGPVYGNAHVAGKGISLLVDTTSARRVDVELLSVDLIPAGERVVIRGLRTASNPSNPSINSPRCRLTRCAGPVLLSNCGIYGLNIEDSAAVAVSASTVGVGVAATRSRLEVDRTSVIGGYGSLLDLAWGSAGPERFGVELIDHSRLVFRGGLIYGTSGTSSSGCGGLFGTQCYPPMPVNTPGLPALVVDGSSDAVLTGGAQVTGGTIGRTCCVSGWVSPIVGNARLDPTVTLTGTLSGGNPVLIVEQPSLVSSPDALVRGGQSTLELRSQPNVSVGLWIDIYHGHFVLPGIDLPFMLSWSASPIATGVTSPTGVYLYPVSAPTVQSYWYRQLEFQVGALFSTGEVRLSNVARLLIY